MEDSISIKSTADDKISEKYPHLFHYTDAHGLLGILRSGSLWATHARYMNDSSEQSLATEEFKLKLIAKLRVIYGEELRENAGVAEAIKSVGGVDALVQKDAAAIVRSAYSVANDLYICSFACSDDAYIKENGLLSQWRGYGARGGVAIVFRTSAIEDFIFLEHENFDYAYLGMFDVVYDSEVNKVERDIAPAIELYAEYAGNLLRSLLLQTNSPDPKEAYNAFHTAISRFKHRGFQEEKEVRIIAGPQRHSDKFMNAMKAAGRRAKAEKPVMLRERNSLLIPYIELFNSPRISEAIERIIIGPSANKEATADALGRHLGEKIKIDVSSIPYN